MGTSSSYSGSSGKPGKDLRTELDAWLDNVDGIPPPTPGEKPDLPQLPLDALTPALFVPAVGRRAGGGAGGNGGSTGGASVGGGAGSGGGGRTSGRNIAGYANTAGRAAAAARALREGDREALDNLGLDFDRLSALPNRFEMVRDIVEAVCAAQSESSIDAEEQRAIAAQVADWVLNPNINASTPASEDVAREAIALIASQVYLTEATAQVDKHSDTVDRAKFEERVAETAQTLASTAKLSNTGATARDISKAIRRAITGLREIHPLRKKNS
jgi:hypothetical protein